MGGYHCGRSSRPGKTVARIVRSAPFCGNEEISRQTTANRVTFHGRDMFWSQSSKANRLNYFLNPYAEPR